MNNIKTISILIVSLLVMMLVAGCENSGAPLAGIPTQYVGNYSGKWITTDAEGPVHETGANHGNWTMTVDAYGQTSLHISSIDESIDENPVASVTADESKGILLALGTYFDQLGGEITNDGTDISGPWLHTDSSIENYTSGTYTGSKN
jgi:hypothetical protein